MKAHLSSLFSAFGLFTAQLAPSQGTLYVSNLGQPSADGVAVGSDQWFANSFSTGSNAGGYVLNRIQLLMNAPSGTPSGFSVAIYGNVPFPGSMKGSLSGANPSTEGIFTYNSSGITLSPSTVYFVVVTGATPVAQGAYLHSFAANNNYNASDNWMLNTYRYTSTDGSSWNRGGFPSHFAVYATAVPEPASYALVGLGLACLSFWRYRSGLAK